MSDAAEAWHLKGIAAHKNGDHAAARILIETAIKLRPDVADFHSNLTMVLRALGEMTAAEESARRALALQPDHGMAHSNLAGLLRARGAFFEAVAEAERAVALLPDVAETQNNLGNALKDSGRTRDATKAYERAIALRPDYALAHWNLSLALLAQGDFERGWEEFAWRWKWGGFPSKARHYGQPLWRGEPLAGKRLLFYPEQGLGDAIQFVRYVPVLRRLGATVILEVPPMLAPLIPTGFADELLISGMPLPAFDLHAPYLDAPLYVKKIPAEVPYLRVDGAGPKGRRVGFNWSGNPNSPVERFRSPPLEAWAPLAEISGIEWVSLQKGPGGDVLPRPPGFKIIETGEAPLAATAALIATLDCVVTTDTAVAHLAGALGATTFLLLHHAPDWRWLEGRTDSPWYPTLRLFRQSEPGNWAPVVAAVARALRERV